MAILTEIVVPRRGSRRRTLVLDGDPWRDIPADVVTAAGLSLGDAVDPESFDAAIADAEERCARERAVRLLTYRDRSSSELASRLLEDGYGRRVSDATVARFVSMGFVDDERFARSLARTLTSTRRLGRQRAAREMSARGIDPTLASEALDEALPAEEEVAAAEALARTLASRAGVTRERIAARLARRGYSPRIALQAARNAVDEADGPFEPDADAGADDG